MEQKAMMKQMVDFYKSAFDNSFKTMITLQQQTETMMNSMMNQANWMPQEGREAINEWVNACKKGRDDFKKVVDDNFKNVESYFK